LFFEYLDYHGYLGVFPELGEIFFIDMLIKRVISRGSAFFEWRGVENGAKK
jgi:hypothetical protein